MPARVLTPAAGSLVSPGPVRDADPVRTEEVTTMEKLTITTPCTAGAYVATSVAVARDAFNGFRRPTTGAEVPLR